MAPLVKLFGPVDSVLGAGVGVDDVIVIEVVLLVVVLANFTTRLLAHRRHRSQASDGADAITRYLPHEVTNVLLVIGSFYYLTLHAHAGMVMSVLVISLFIADFFEFEARRVEARREIPLERPKGALTAGALVLGYAAYQVLFFLVKGGLAAIV
ncbi:MAG: hypothetical protein ABEH56_07785 [Salinirussus sp.]